MKKHVFLKGERIHLRALERKDVDGNYFQWLNDPEVCQFNSHAIFPNTESSMFEFLESQHKAADKVVLAIIDSETDIHIGNLSLQRIDWLCRQAEFAILVGEKEYWGKGYSTEAAILICNYGFTTLNLNRIYCGTSELNVGMQKLAAKLKMKKEGVRREALFKNGQHNDLFEYGVLRSEFLAE